MSQLRATGLRTDSPWRQPNFDGIWSAALRSTFGENKVTCFLESKSPGIVEAVEPETKIHRPGRGEVDVFLAFAQVAQVLCKEPGLPEAIEAQADWTSGKWRLMREPFATGSGYGLVLRYR